MVKRWAVEFKTSIFDEKSSGHLNVQDTIKETIEKYPQCYIKELIIKGMQVC